jgi:hypothetical protein
VYCLSLTGCSSEAKQSPIEQIETLPTTAQLDTISLGQFVICVPLPTSQDRKCDQVQVEFELYAAVMPRYASHVKHEMERLEGRLRDAVIQACRHTPVDDLLAPLLSTFKAHLEETIRPYFANASIERVHIADIQIRQL